MNREPRLRERARTKVAASADAVVGLTDWKNPVDVVCGAVGSPAEQGSHLRSSLNLLMDLRFVHGHVS